MVFLASAEVLPNRRVNRTRYGLRPTQAGYPFRWAAHCGA
jgi:hypothetical protein